MAESPITAPRRPRRVRANGNGTLPPVGEMLTRVVPFVSGSDRLYSLHQDRDGKLTNPETVRLEVLDQMRRDDTIAAGLMLIKAPILGRAKRHASIDCEDEKIKATLTDVLLESGLFYRAVRTQLRALEFGIAAHEKQWEVVNLDVVAEEVNEETGEKSEVQAWRGAFNTIVDLREVNPQTITAIRRRSPDAPVVSAGTEGKPRDDSFDGFEQKLPNQNAPVWVEPIKAFVYAHDVEYGNLWGRSRIRACYPFYFWKQVMWKVWSAWAERKAAPTRIARHPVGVDPVSGQNNALTAAQYANIADAVTGLALPSNTYPDSKTEMWSFGEITTTDRTQVFQAIIQEINKAILHAMFVPERSFQEGHFGTLAESAAQIDVFLMTEDALVADVVDTFNDYVTRPLLLANWGPDAPRAAVTVPGMTDDEGRILDNIMLELVKHPEGGRHVDIRALLERYSVPLADVQEVEPEAETEPPTPEPDEDEETG